MREYYFISYWCRNIETDSEFFTNEVIDRNPLDWLYDIANDNNETEELALIWSTPITESQYNKLSEIC